MSATTPCNKMEKMKKQQSTFLLALNEKDWDRRERIPALKADNSTRNNQIDNNKVKRGSIHAVQSTDPAGGPGNVCYQTLQQNGENDKTSINLLANHE